MKILHIAAFEGNIGDNASHLGFKNILDEVLDAYIIDRLEIRKSYRNYNGQDKLYFDEQFCKLANTYDLVVFGGGGFLDYWVEGSSNGTTIDISIDNLEKISTRILITSIGCNPHKKVPKENFSKFKSFLYYVKNTDRITIALRNDGSKESIKRDFGCEYLDGIVEILDHGYFYTPTNNLTLPIENKYVAINVTDDQLSMGAGMKISRESYYFELDNLVRSLSNIGYKTVFVPHIHQDVEAIGSVLSRLSSSNVRSNTIIAPCMQGDLGTDFIFNIYKNADFVIASRYHANVCSINLGTPVLGLSLLKRIQYTHQQMINEKSSIEIGEGFSKKILEYINNFDDSSMNRINNLFEMKVSTLKFYKEFFNRNIIMSINR